jgi:hypothetical protein
MTNSKDGQAANIEFKFSHRIPALKLANTATDACSNDGRRKRETTGSIT